MQGPHTLRSRSLLLVAVVLIVSGSATALAFGWQSGVRPVKTLSVHDANGRLVGQVLETRDGAAVVAVQVGAGQAFLVLGRNQIEDIPVGNTIPQRVVFESEDCTGEPYAEAFTDENNLFPVVIKTGSKLYSLSGSGQTVQVRSVLETDGLCGQLEFETFASPTEQLADLASEFQPPFTVRAR